MNPRSSSICCRMGLGLRSSQGKRSFRVWNFLYQLTTELGSGVRFFLVPNLTRRRSSGLNASAVCVLVKGDPPAFNK